MKILLEKYQAVITIDDADLPMFSSYRWRVNRRHRHVSRSESGKTILLHRQIMDAPDGLVVDHIDRNPLNNCRSNLRVVTQQVNTWNRAVMGETIGVSPSRGKWRAMIEHSGKKLDLGFFVDKADAIAARDVASRILRRDIGPQNDASAEYADFRPHFFAPTARKALLDAMSR